MRIVSTSDVPLEDLQRFAAILGPEFEVTVDESQVFLRSAEPPSWVTFLAEASWWTKVFGAYAALYVAELVKEAAKETWRKRGKALVVVRTAGDRLRELAVAVADLRSRLSAPTILGIGLPVPNEFFSTRLSLEGANPDALVAQLALFLHHLPALSRLISEQGPAEGKVATGLFLQLRDDGALLISWQDAQTLQVREHTLELRDAV